jgi:hypothetical protein
MSSMEHYRYRQHGLPQVQGFSVMLILCSAEKFITIKIWIASKETEGGLAHNLMLLLVKN